MKNLLKVLATGCLFSALASHAVAADMAALVTRLMEGGSAAAAEVG